MPAVSSAHRNRLAGPGSSRQQADRHAQQHQAENLLDTVHPQAGLRQETAFARAQRHQRRAEAEAQREQRGKAHDRVAQRGDGQQYPRQRRGDAGHTTSAEKKPITSVPA